MMMKAAENLTKVNWKFRLLVGDAQQQLVSLSLSTNQVLVAWAVVGI